ncbi:MAG TPA: hypothetical protein VMU99_07925 [Acidimicrobiales bacterium]|nr:hypothetical protein [Acidimicrobiales bacterium]
MIWEEIGTGTGHDAGFDDLTLSRWRTGSRGRTIGMVGDEGSGKTQFTELSRRMSPVPDRQIDTFIDGSLIGDGSLGRVDSLTCRDVRANLYPREAVIPGL